MFDLIWFAPQAMVTWLTERRINRGRPEAAVALARRVAVARRNDPEIWDCLYRIMKRTGSNANDLALVLRKGLDATPRSAKLGWWLFFELSRQEKYAEARQLLRQFEELEVSQVVYLQLMRAFAAIIDGDLDLASREFDVGLQASGAETDEEAVLSLVNVLILFPRAETNQKGVELLERLVNARPANPAAYVTLAQVIKDSDRDRASQLIAEARRRWGRRAGFEDYVARWRDPGPGPEWEGLEDV